MKNLKLIKTSLKQNDRVICKSCVGINYTGKVISVYKSEGVEHAKIETEREIRTINGSITRIWNVERNSTGTWDGCFEREYYRFNRSRTGKIINRKSYGTWLYNNRINNWKSELET